MSNTNSYEKKLRATMHCAGYTQPIKIADALQGSVWRASQQSSDKQIIIKAVKRILSDKQIAIVDNMKCNVHEDVTKEKKIMKYLTKDKQCPQSIIKYADFFKRYLLCTGFFCSV